MNFHRNNKYKLNQETADAALQNILAACDRPPSTISSDELILQQKRNTRLHVRLHVLIAIALLLAFLLPLIIVPEAAKLLDRQGTLEPAALVNDYVENGSLYLELSGDNILYEEAWMTSLDDEIISGTYDESTGLISFPFPDSGDYNIFIPVEDDDPFHLLLTLN